MLNLNPAINKNIWPIRGSEKLVSGCGLEELHLVSGCGVGFAGFYINSGADAGFGEFRLRRVSSDPQSGTHPIFDRTNV
jgi:hypothetical protein